MAAHRRRWPPTRPWPPARGCTTWTAAGDRAGRCPPPVGSPGGGPRSGDRRPARGGGRGPRTGGRGRRWSSAPADRPSEVLGSGAGPRWPMVSWGTTANVSVPVAARPERPAGGNGAVPGGRGGLAPRRRAVGRRLATGLAGPYDRAAGRTELAKLARASPPGARRGDGHPVAGGGPGAVVAARGPGWRSSGSTHPRPRRSGPGRDRSGGLGGAALPRGHGPGRPSGAAARRAGPRRGPVGPCRCGGTCDRDHRSPGPAPTVGPGRVGRGRPVGRPGGGPPSISTLDPVIEPTNLIRWRWPYARLRPQSSGWPAGHGADRSARAADATRTRAGPGAPRATGRWRRPG